MIRNAYLETAATAATLLREPTLAARWSAPSALADYTIGGLAHHLAFQVTDTRARIAAAAVDTPAIPVLSHYTRNSWVTSGVDGADNVDIRTRNQKAAAATTATAVADDVETALAALRQLVPDQPTDRVVDLGDWGLTIDDFLLTRMLELVVHTDDLAVSLGVPTPPLPAEATAATIRLLTEIATWRHGAIPVLRALSRQERAPVSISAF